MTSYQAEKNSKKQNLSSNARIKSMRPLELVDSIPQKIRTDVTIVKTNKNTKRENFKQTFENTYKSDISSSLFIFFFFNQSYICDVEFLTFKDCFQ